MDEFELTCNWISDSDKTLACSVVCSPENKGIESVTAETCVCLIQNVNSSSRPELEIKSKHSLKELNIYSEASLIEVFGVYNEYLCTCKAEFLDDWEGLAVYHANIKLPAISTCTLKFTRMRENDRLWVYSIQPKTVKSNSSNNTLFNFQNVINLLSSNCRISEKDVEKIVESQLKALSLNPPFKCQSLLNPMEKYQDSRKSKSGFMNQNEKSSNNVENEFLINYIDRKFIEIKGELMKQMEINLEQIRMENDAKLDKIIKLIENAKL